MKTLTDHDADAIRVLLQARSDSLTENHRDRATGKVEDAEVAEDIAHTERLISALR